MSRVFYWIVFLTKEGFPYLRVHLFLFGLLLTCQCVGQQFTPLWMRTAGNSVYKPRYTINAHLNWHRLVVTTQNRLKSQRKLIPIWNKQSFRRKIIRLIYGQTDHAEDVKKSYPSLDGPALRLNSVWEIDHDSSELKNLSRAVLKSFLLRPRKAKPQICGSRNKPTSYIPIDQQNATKRIRRQRFRILQGNGLLCRK